MISTMLLPCCLKAQLDCTIQEANIYSTQFISFDSDCECSAGQNCAYVRIFLEDLSGVVFQCQGWGVEVDRSSLSILIDHIDVFSTDCSEYLPLSSTQSVYNQLIDFQSGGFIDVIICAGSEDPSINGIDITFQFSDYCFPVDCTNDITPPTCTAQDITINGDSSVGTVPITFTDYIIDDCGEVSFVSGFESIGDTPFSISNDENLSCDFIQDQGFVVTFSDESGNQITCNYIVTVECTEDESDPCNDLSASLIPNPGFEILANGQEPTNVSQLNRAASWEQATEATSDYFGKTSYPSRSDRPDMVNPFPPNESDHWVGGWRDPDNFKDDPSIPGIQQQEYIEYIGACLLQPVIANQSYTLSLDLGAPTESTGSPAVLQEELVVLGLPNCNFPISGEDCKEDNYEVIGRKPILITGGTWQESVDVDIMSSENYPAIMFGLSCSGSSVEPSVYFLADDLLMVQGDIECGNSCFSITADSPPCNADIQTENQSTYTYDFTFTNQTDTIFSQILLFDADDNFNIDEGTLMDLGTTLSPGQSIDLSWDIDAMSSFSEETVTYCFEIAPYNQAGGACCKAQHCVELTNCCEVLAPAKSIIEADTESCCYNFGYETCVEDYFVEAEIEMLTEGLGISSNFVLDGFSVTQMSDTRLIVTMNGGGFFPQGDFDEVMQFCVDGMNSMSPEEQEISITWTALIGDITGIFQAETCPLACVPPEDDCAELIDPELYCDDNGVYHYQFRIKNINDRELDASIAVLGPSGNTVPADFSQATFPDFPDHTPNGAPYLVYDQTTDFIDITLPNAVLGSMYEFIISLHDYRNIDPVTGDYWCCYTPVAPFVIDVDESCFGGGFTDPNPVEYFVYPNPSEDVFTVRFLQPIENPSELLLVNINGEVKNRIQLAEGTMAHTMNISDFNTGMYFVSVKDEDGNEFGERFLKK